MRVEAPRDDDFQPQALHASLARHQQEAGVDDRAEHEPPIDRALSERRRKLGGGDLWRRDGLLA